jgi:hypothetical protein
LYGSGTTSVITSLLFVDGRNKRLLPFFRPALAQAAGKPVFGSQLRPQSSPISTGELGQ